MALNTLGQLHRAHGMPDAAVASLLEAWEALGHRTDEDRDERGFNLANLIGALG